MVMREKQSRNLRERNPQLIDSLHGAPAGIDDELFVSNFYERAGSEAIHSRGRRPAPQKSNPEKISRGFGHELHHNGSIDYLAKANSCRAELTISIGSWAAGYKRLQWRRMVDFAQIPRAVT